MEKKYQIFISSTYKDLIEEREKVRDVILSMYHFPIGMEMFNAADEEQWEIIRETIDSSDYYILIVGKRYGSIIPDGMPDAGMSYTEKEYRYARENGIPIMAFIKKDTAITSDKMDLEPEKIAKLQAFVREITTTRETDWFATVDELGTQVSLALHKQMDRKKRPGWVRGDRFDLDASLSELVTLSKQVRELTEENTRLKAFSVSRAPAINVSLQFAGTIDKPLELIADDDNGDAADVGDEAFPVTEIVERFQVPKTGYLCYEEPITLKDIPSGERALVSQRIIDTYNSKLPDRATVDKYNEDMRYYNEVRKNGQLLNFIISNDGTAKATDINITLEFPKSFDLLERKDAERLTEPKKPKMPDRPIEIALSQALVEEPLRKILRSERTLASLSPMSFSSKDALSAILDNTKSKDWNVSIYGQRVELWNRSLLHTYAWTVDDLCIIPKEKGTFTIRVTKMCEEYPQPELSELTITVQ